jgi:CheY-like chemotaxis protein
MPKPVVLVVDDEEANLEMCREVLELNSYHVVLARDAREAVELLSRHEVDFVICDVSMPHNGIRVYEHLLQHFPGLRGRFIFVTGSHAHREQVEQLPQAAPCLMKPFSVRVLLDTVKGALGA